MVALRRLSLFIFATLSVGALFMFAMPVQAALNPTEDACNKLSAAERKKSAVCNVDEPNENPVTTVVGRVTTVAAVIAGIIAVVMIIVSGFRYITAAGDANQAKSARSGIMHAIIGLVVIALATVIIQMTINLVG